ncbi:MAG: DUF1292 domain-containing protein [Clostridia bacterium]|nr:DUF1292 domain-containing protein [Clostridia bacterium]MBR0444007.1 DUF1292 domain-containing protein [Clostridia bacterium]
MEENNIVTLVDENGKEVEFDLVMTFDYEGNRYAALLPMEEIENVGSDEVVLLQIVTEGREEQYVSIDNPILLDEVFNEFIDLFDAQFDDEDGED